MNIRFWIAGLVFAGCATGADSSAAPVTFNRDVLPILQRNCQTCHRPGNIAPMSFLTYEGTRPWAKAIKSAVAMRKMPPWFADPQVGHYSNDRSLKQNEIDTIVKWADSGAPQGDAKDAPPAVEWPQNGWTTQPDIVLNGVPYTVPAAPAKSVIEWMTLTTATGFTKDTWATSVEIKPSELAVTHHICVSFVPHRPGTVYNTLLWVDKQRDEDGVEVAPADRKFARPTADGRGEQVSARIRNNAPAGRNSGADNVGGSMRTVARTGAPAMVLLRGLFGARLSYLPTAMNISPVAKSCSLLMRMPARFPSIFPASLNRIDRAG